MQKVKKTIDISKRFSNFIFFMVLQPFPKSGWYEFESTHVGSLFYFLSCVFLALAASPLLLFPLLPTYTSLTQTQPKLLLSNFSPQKFNLKHQTKIQTSSIDFSPPSPKLNSNPKSLSNLLQPHLHHRTLTIDSSTESPLSPKPHDLTSITYINSTPISNPNPNLLHNVTS